jgi:hypothetical protein
MYLKEGLKASSINITLNILGSVVAKQKNKNWTTYTCD